MCYIIFSTFFYTRKMIIIIWKQYVFIFCFHEISWIRIILIILLKFDILFVFNNNWIVHSENALLISETKMLVYSGFSDA